MVVLLFFCVPMEWDVFDEKSKEILFYPLICITFSHREIRLHSEKNKIKSCFLAHLH